VFEIKRPNALKDVGFLDKSVVEKNRKRKHNSKKSINAEGCRIDFLASVFHNDNGEGEGYTGTQSCKINKLILTV